VSDEVGSVGEEAAKLLQALQDWAKESGADYAGAATSAAEGAATTWQRVNEHVATGGEDCRYCPLCQVISAVRGTSPEVREHLATAATSLMHAAAGMLATTVPGPEERRGRRAGPVEKIDLDDQDWEGER
jgi:hypothetical protein